MWLIYRHLYAWLLSLHVDLEESYSTSKFLICKVSALYFMWLKGKFTEKSQMEDPMNVGKNTFDYFLISCLVLEILAFKVEKFVTSR